ncbi:DNA glycosylase [Durotheca rogersii]|uniref:DNA glycosylase n=1 Tax=Durotheca rogersii TaxID=419775 RepID=UPI00221EF60C|nr:DNA glycosylase [Durotheca rogersii]KAI5862238.1 DNA glycosylase [Durotheca rogersii]
MAKTSSARVKAAGAEPPATLRRSARNASKKEEEEDVESTKREDLPTRSRGPAAAAAATAPPSRRSKRARTIKGDESEAEAEAAERRPRKVAKKEEEEEPSPQQASGPARGSRGKQKAAGGEDKAATLRAKKLKSYARFANESPYPDFARPTAAECERAHAVLVSIHGARVRPAGAAAAPTDRAGCGESPSVLDALVRTILSQNTSNSNSARAKLDMDEVYGPGGGDESAEQARWRAVAEGGAAKLERAIARGGLGGVKSRAIVDILRQVEARYGTYSLDHLLQRAVGAGVGAEDYDDEAAMRELISFRGVGPKTASCVLLFCAGRDSFAVDTHVHRITGQLGWRPAGASRDEAFAHLDARVPPRLKYALHVLLVEHGRACDECRAGGRSRGRCALRRAFPGGRMAAEGEVRTEEEEEKAEKDEKEGDGYEEAIEGKGEGEEDDKVVKSEDRDKGGEQDAVEEEETGNAKIMKEETEDVRMMEQEARVIKREDGDAAKKKENDSDREEDRKFKEETEGTDCKKEEEERVKAEA